jgi:uncharacterized LabA/DUF88 family protein
MPTARPTAAILLDGGFVKKKLEENLHRFPRTSDLVALVASIMGKPRLVDTSLFRAFFYDSPPLEQSLTNPLDGSTRNYGATQVAKDNRALIDSLELEPDFAVRRGTLKSHGWKLGRAALIALKAHPRPLQANDLVPDLEQKGVDLRIGLDIATIAVKRIVDILVVVSGDSDLVPALKFARREGQDLRVHSEAHPVARDFKAHCDFVL